MTTIYLARHGESDWNAANRFQGLSDRPLTELGRRQAEALADELATTASPSAIYSSPLRRAFETAAIVGTRTGLEPRPVDDLREVDVGGWAGLSRSDVESRFPEAFRRWLDGGEGWEDGESYADMSARVLAALTGVAESHPGDRGPGRLARRADPRDPGRGRGHGRPRLSQAAPRRAERAPVQSGRRERPNHPARLSPWRTTRTSPPLTQPCGIAPPPGGGDHTETTPERRSRWLLHAPSSPRQSAP